MTIIAKNVEHCFSGLVAGVVSEKVRITIAAKTVVAVSNPMKTSTLSVIFARGLVGGWGVNLNTKKRRTGSDALLP